MSASAVGSKTAMSSGWLEKTLPLFFKDYQRKRLLQRAQNWGVSGGMAAVAGTIALVYFTEWRDVLENIPIIKKKYDGKPREE